MKRYRFPKLLVSDATQNFSNFILSQSTRVNLVNAGSIRHVRNDFIRPNFSNAKFFPIVRLYCTSQVGIDHVPRIGLHHAFEFDPDFVRPISIYPKGGVNIVMMHV